MDEMLIAILIGSWVVPVITLIISWYVTRIYLMKLRNDAVKAGEKAQEAADNVATDLIHDLDLVERRLITLIESLPEPPNVSDEIKKVLPELREAITKTVDGKIANMIRQVRSATRDEVEKEVEMAKAELGQDGMPSLGQGLLSLIFQK